MNEVSALFSILKVQMTLKHTEPRKLDPKLNDLYLI